MSTRLRTSATVIAIAMALTACGGDSGSDTDTGADTGSDTTTDSGDVSAPATLEVTGTDQLAFEPASLSTAAGEVTVTLTSGESVNHNIVIEELDDLMVVEAAAGATESGTVTLEAGTYTFYCDVPGHRAAGMEGTLEVA